MNRITLIISATALAGCTQTLGSVPSASQLRSAVDQVEGWKSLSTVNCEGRTECYNAAFGHTRARNVKCAATNSREANCEYEVLVGDQESNWELRQSDFRIDVGPDGKTGWRLVSPDVN